MDQYTKQVKIFLISYRYTTTTRVLFERCKTSTISCRIVERYNAEPNNGSCTKYWQSPWYDDRHCTVNIHLQCAIRSDLYQDSISASAPHPDSTQVNEDYDYNRSRGEGRAVIWGAQELTRCTRCCSRSTVIRATRNREVLSFRVHPSATPTSHGPTSSDDYSVIFWFDIYLYFIYSFFSFYFI